MTIDNLTGEVTWDFSPADTVLDQTVKQSSGSNVGLFVFR